MEPAQPASDAAPQPDHPNANNEKVGPEDLNPFEKEQAQVAHKYAMDIINKQVAARRQIEKQWMVSECTLLPRFRQDPLHRVKEIRLQWLQS